MRVGFVASTSASTFAGAGYWAGTDYPVLPPGSLSLEALWQPVHKEVYTSPGQELVQLLVPVSSGDTHVLEPTSLLHHRQLGSLVKLRPVYLVLGLSLIHI